MRALMSFERLMERVVEGSVKRLLGSRLQPVEIAKKLARAMEDGQVMGADGARAPNSYTVLLNPEDHALYGAYEATLERELADFLVQAAAERGLVLASRPHVDVQADPRVGRQSLLVEAHLADARPEPDPNALALAGSTARLNLRSAEAPQPPSVPPATAPAATGFGLANPAGGPARKVDRIPFTLGRALDNDLVVEDRRVSRHHAQIKELSGQLWLVDLGSTNGTAVNGRPIAETVLRAGDLISLGGYTLRIVESAHES